MEENKTKQELDALCDKIDSKIEESSQQVKDNLKHEVDNFKSNEIKDLLDKHTNVVDRLDKIEVENKKDASFPVYKTKNEAFKDAFENSESLKAMKNKSSDNANVEVKADVLISSAFSGANSARDATGVDKLPGIYRDPAAYTNMRDVIPVGTTAYNVVRFVKEASWTDNAAAVAEGSAPSDSEFTLSANDAIVQKLTSIMTISQEMLEDSGGQLSSYLSARIPAKLNALLDTQLISGNGTSPNLQGIATNAGSTDFDESSSGAFYQSIDNATALDVIIVALNQLALANYTADTILLNPTDFHKIYLLKSTTNEYLRGNSVTSADGFLRINGVRCLVNTQISAGQVVVGNFSMGSQIWQREGLSVSFGYENGTNFASYLVSVRGMIRVAHSIYSSNAYIWVGNITNAKAAIETP